MLLVINQYYNKDNFLTAIVAQPDVKAGISEQKGQAVIGTRHHLAEFILNIINIKDTARITGCQKIILSDISTNIKVKQLPSRYNLSVVIYRRT